MLVPSRGDILEWFGLWVEVPELAHFLKDGKQTAIGELETLVVAMSFLVWHQRLRSNQLVVYINNKVRNSALSTGIPMQLHHVDLCACCNLP